jgi:hypothetical protein
MVGLLLKNQSCRCGSYRRSENLNFNAYRHLFVQFFASVLIFNAACIYCVLGYHVVARCCFKIMTMIIGNNGKGNSNLYTDFPTDTPDF